MLARGRRASSAERAADRVLAPRLRPAAARRSRTTGTTVHEQARGRGGACSARSAPRGAAVAGHGFGALIALDLLLPPRRARACRGAQRHAAAGARARRGAGARCRARGARGGAARRRAGGGGRRLARGPRGGEQRARARASTPARSSPTTRGSRAGPSRAASCARSTHRSSCLTRAGDAGARRRRIRRARGAAAARVAPTRRRPRGRRARARRARAELGERGLDRGLGVKPCRGKERDRTGVGIDEQLDLRAAEDHALRTRADEARDDVAGSRGATPRARPRARARRRSPRGPGRGRPRGGTSTSIPCAAMRSREEVGLHRVARPEQPDAAEARRPRSPPPSCRRCAAAGSRPPPARPRPRGASCSCRAAAARRPRPRPSARASASSRPAVSHSPAACSALTGSKSTDHMTHGAEWTPPSRRRVASLISR